MESENIIMALVDVHNRLTEISVRGDDAIRMAGVLQRCRALVNQMQSAKEAEASDEDA